VVEDAIVVVQAEQERADDVSLRGIPKAADDAVRGANPFDLLHSGSLGALIRKVESLGDDSVRSRVIGKPCARLGRPTRRRAHANVTIVSQVLVSEQLQSGAPLGERTVGDVDAILDQQIEHEKQGRRLRRQSHDPRRGGMKAEEQRIEREVAIDWDDKLTVEHELLGRQFAKGVDDLREVASERLTRFRPQIDLAARAKCQAPETVPLGLVLPLRSNRQHPDGSGLHWRVPRLDREFHWSSS
jgi:hypothetical protein